MSTSYVQIILRGGDSKKMQIALQKYNRFKGKKDDVLIEAFRAWFDAQQNSYWKIQGEKRDG